MTTFLFTSPATDMRTGQHGTLVLTDGGSPGQRGDGTLVLTGDPDNLTLHGAGPAGGVPLSEVDCLEITSYTAAPAGWDAAPTSAVILHLRDGSAVTYRLTGANPALLREIFIEAGWSRPCRRSQVDGRIESDGRLDRWRASPGTPARTSAR